MFMCLGYIYIYIYILKIVAAQRKIIVPSEAVPP